MTNSKLNLYMYDPTYTHSNQGHLGLKLQTRLYRPTRRLLLDVVLSLSLALVFGTIFLPMSLQHLLCPLSENV